MPRSSAGEGRLVFICVPFQKHSYLHHYSDRVIVKEHVIFKTRKMRHLMGHDLQTPFHRSVRGVGPVDGVRHVDGTGRSPAGGSRAHAPRGAFRQDAQPPVCPARVWVLFAPSTHDPHVLHHLRPRGHRPRRAGMTESSPQVPFTTGGKARTQSLSQAVCTPSPGAGVREGRPPTSQTPSGAGTSYHRAPSHRGSLLWGLGTRETPTAQAQRAQGHCVPLGEVASTL